MARLSHGLLLLLAFAAGTSGCKKLKSVVRQAVAEDDAGPAATASVAPAPSAAPSASSATSAAPVVSAAAPTVDPIVGKWSCRFSNRRGASVSETVTFATPVDASTKVSVTGVDGVGSRYGGSGTASQKEGVWTVTLRWTNNASPTWVRFRPSADGKTTSGRRGKADDPGYEGPYNCSKVG